MLKQIAVVLSLVVGIYALPAQAGDPIFGGGSVKSLSQDQTKKVTAKGAYSDYYGYYGYVQAYNAYVNGYNGWYYGAPYEATYYYNAYLYSADATNLLYTAFVYSYYYGL